ncbi:MAG: EAL domain-containing protein [Sulfuricurvum sp.]|nr:EAL domain-containing protein [Sulfuricurvum sp.]
MKLTTLDLENHLNLLSIENSPDAIYWLDRSGKIVHANKAAYENLGYSREEMLHMNVNDIDAIADTPEKYATIFDKTSAQGFITIQTLHRRKDKSVIKVEIKGYPFSHNGVEYNVMYVRQLDNRIAYEHSQEMQRLDFAISSSEDGIWEYDIKANTTFVSKRWLKIIGYSEDEYHSSIESWKALLHPDDAEKALRTLYGSIANKIESAHVQYRIRHKDGRWLWIYDRAKILFDPFGEPLIVAGFRTDITIQKELQTHNEELAAIVQHASTEVYILDAETLHYLYANDGALLSLGYTLEELHHLHLTDINPNVGEEEIEIFRQYLDTISPILTNHSFHKRKDGSLYPVHSTVYKLTYQGQPAFVIFDTNMSELNSAQDRLHYLATHDPLTGLPNRILFIDRLQMAIKQMSRKEEKIAVLFVDLDHFKQVNDSLGHSVGDKLLIEVAKRLQLLLRESDTIARMGGDEFNILLDGLINTDTIIKVSQKLIAAFQEPFIINEQHLYTTLSIGIAIYPNDGSTAEELLKNADAAMYKAKSEGRNTYQFYASEMSGKALERVILENSLRIAIKENQFQVFYQPQINLITGIFIGMEALIRWIHPSLGIVSPANFIPFCEEIGLIQEIDFFVLENVIKQQAIWHGMGIDAPTVAVNFSAKTLANRFIVDEVRTVMELHGCQKEWIAIEVTESHIMKNPEEAIQILGAFKELGLKIAIDDFGTGYSSLSYLKRLPIDKLKIDQSFIRDIPHDEDDMAITKTIIALAHNLKLDVIAEGVEEIEHQLFLIENGCALGQGYLYSKPVDTESITALLKSDKKWKHEGQIIDLFFDI